MVKLYRTSGGVTEYWEAWFTATEVTIHWGKVGEKGQSRELPHEASVHPAEIIKREAKPLRAAGFKPKKANELHSVVIQYEVDGHGTVNEHDRRVRVEELMNECLGWCGLGHCDGGDMGSGQMNVFCYVVDVAVAERVIVSDLKEHGLLDGAVIAERKQDAAKVLWPHDFVGTFAIL
jgi:predicted DNA-binding WGR domain protein